jgi:GGDEF domain-containing protein
VVALLGGLNTGLLHANPLSREAVTTVLYLVDPSTPPDEAWSPRAGTADRILYRPIETAEFRAQVIASLRQSLARRSAPSVGDTISFLRERIRSSRRAIVPLVLPDRPCVTSHPGVSTFIGPEADPQVMLESLVAHELASRRVVDRMRSCPSCASTALVFGESCAACGSPDFIREPMIHHFSCGHVDVARQFSVGNELSCPKCSKALRQIGRDYERPANCVRCNTCGSIAAEPRILVRCSSCRRSCTPEATSELLIHAYDLTSRAEEAVSAGSLAGASLESALAKRTGSCAKALFVYELERELDRHRRYSSPCALLMVRLEGLLAIRTNLVAQYARLVEQACTVITSQLRTLDLITIWDDDLLAILLPEAPISGAHVVADRIENGIATISAANETLNADVAIAPSDSAFTTAQSMIDACLASLSRPPTRNIDGSDTQATMLPAGPQDDTALVIVEDDTRSRPGTRNPSLQRTT